MYLDEEITNIERGKVYKGEPLRFFLNRNQSYMIVLKNGYINDDLQYKVTDIKENVTIAMSVGCICNFRSSVTIIEIELERE